MIATQNCSRRWRDPLSIGRHGSAFATRQARRAPAFALRASARFRRPTSPFGLRRVSPKRSAGGSLGEAERSARAGWAEFFITLLRNAGAIVVALGLSQTSSGQNVNPEATGQSRGAERLELSGFVGGSSFQQSLGSASNLYQSVSGAAGNIDFGKLFGFRASWAFTKNIAAEFNLSTGTNAYVFAVDDIEVGSLDLGEQFEADQLFWNGSFVFQVPSRYGVVPYAAVGFGRLETTPSSPLGDVEKVSATDVSFGGGVKLWLPSVSWLGFRFDARYHTASDGLNFPGNDEAPTGTEVTVGATVRLF